MLWFELVTWIAFAVLLALFRFFLPRNLAGKTQASVTIVAVIAAVLGGFIGRAIAPEALVGRFNLVGLILASVFAMGAISLGCYRRCGTGIKPLRKPQPH